MKNLRQRTTDASGRPVRQMVEARQSAEKTLDLFIYDDIMPDGYDWWSGEEIESETSAAHIRGILDEHKDVTQINLFVNSLGGSVIEAMGIRAHLLRHPAQKTAYVDGWAASAASFLLTSCDEVLMLTGSMQMLHSMWMLVTGNAKELRKAADDLDRIMVGNREMYLEKAGGKLTEEELIQLMEAETWLGAQECVELGLADRVLAAADYKDMKQRVQAAMYGIDLGQAADEDESDPADVPVDIEGAETDPQQEIDEGEPAEAVEPATQEAEPEADEPPKNLLAAFQKAAGRTEV